jgi:hypothetical protein
MSAETSLQVPTTVDDSDPQTLLIIAGTVLCFALLAFGLGRLARRLPPQVPRVVLLVMCASFFPLTLGAIGFSLYGGEEDFFEWITHRAPRAYRNLSLLLAASFVAAALGLRRRKHVVDVSTFE